MMMHWGIGMGGWGMALMATSALLFWSLIIAGIVVLVGYTVGRNPRREESVPQRTLAERFARGEIDAEDYRRRRQALNGEDPQSRLS
jgi:putative membrane protein